MRNIFGKKTFLAAAAAVVMFGSTNISVLAEAQETQPQEGDTYELKVLGSLPILTDTFMIWKE